jgi:hypothetical protein
MERVVSLIPRRYIWFGFVTYYLLCNRWLIAQTIPQLTFEVREGVSRGTLIGNVRTNWRLLDQYPDSVRRTLCVYIVSHNTDTVLSSLIALNEVTGDLTTLTELDREWLCIRQGEGCDVLTMLVAISPSKYYSVIKVDIHVLDVNDNAPTFPAMASRYVEWVIRENAMIGTRFLLPSAEDPDADINSVQRYELDDQGDGHFALSNESTNGSPTLEDVYLVLIQPLDRETIDSYWLTVIAWDGGQPSLSAVLRVHVTVTDFNDNMPVCEQDVFEAYISENATPGEEIGRVSATDADQSINGHVTYALESAANHDRMFKVDSESGTLTLVTVIDREIAARYDFYVTAKDGDIDRESSLTAFCKVIVHVIDENDNAPIIDVRTLDGHRDFIVKDNVPPGTIVAMVTVSDADDPLTGNGQISCVLLSNASNSTIEQFILTSVSQHEYQILSNSMLNNELLVESTHILSIACEDRGRPALATELSVTITVQHSNDNAPAFSTLIYKVQLRENSPVGSVVVNISASDLDPGDYGRVHYALHNTRGVTDEPVLYIDERSGQVSTRVVFDYEMQSIYRYIVVAVDGGQPHAKSSSVLLVLEVTDINDNAPEFSRHHFTFSISEHAPLFTQVGIVCATDADSYPYNRLVYALERDSINFSPFSIDSRTGSLYVKRSLNRHTPSQYHLRVIVTNGNAYSNMKDTCNVTVVILRNYTKSTLRDLAKFSESASSNRLVPTSSTWIHTYETRPMYSSATTNTPTQQFEIMTRHISTGILVDALSDEAKDSWSRLRATVPDFVIFAMVTLLPFTVIITLTVAIVYCCRLCGRCDSDNTGNVVKVASLVTDEHYLDIDQATAAECATKRDDVLVAIDSIVRLGATLNRLDKQRMRSSILWPLHYNGRLSRSCEFITTANNQVCHVALVI